MRNLSCRGLALGVIIYLSLPAQSQSFPDLRKEDIDACVEVLKLHGVLSRAQFQCGFTEYSSRLTDFAQGCAKRIPTSEMQQALRFGMNAFDRQEKDHGHAQVCKMAVDDIDRIQNEPQSTPPAAPKNDVVPWDPGQAIRNELLDRSIVQTQICLKDSLKLALRSGLRNRADLVDFVSKLCVAQSFVMGKQFGLTSNETANMLEALAYNELDRIIALGR